MQSSPDSQGFALPAVVNPTDYKHYCIPIPNDPAYIQAFYGVMYDLSIWLSWQRDTAHTGVQAAQVMKSIYNHLTAGDYDGCNMFDIRLDPTNSCQVQKTYDGGLTWIDAFSMELCAAGVANGIVDLKFPPNNPPSNPQPGEQPGGSSPTPGQCFTINMTINANALALIPVAVDSGWTLSISNITGAWTDGAFAPSNLWFCYDGHQFVLGACTSFTAPAPSTAPHYPGLRGELLLRHPDGTVEPIVGGTMLTVPSGVGTGNYYLQINDDNLSDNSGSIQLTLTACNIPEAPLWASPSAGRGTLLSQTHNMDGSWTGIFESVTDGGTHWYCDVPINRPSGNTTRTLQVISWSWAGSTPNYIDSTTPPYGPNTSGDFPTNDGGWRAFFCSSSTGPQFTLTITAKQATP